MKKSVVWIMFVAIFVLTASVFAHAAGHWRGFRQLEAYRLLFSAEQNKKLDATLAPAKQELPPLFKELRVQREQLHALLKSETAKDSDIKAQIDKISESQYQLALKRATLIRNIRKIATPDQLAKIDALEAKHLKHREKVMDAMKGVFLQEQGD
jgi:Spy/CpxP family protein refolding chaperone